MRSKTIHILFKQIGFLLIIEGMVMIPPALVSFIAREWYSLAGFVISGFAISGIGFLIKKIFEEADDPQYNHAFIVAAAGWLAVTLMGSIPFILIALITPETVSNNYIPTGADYQISSLVFFKNPLHSFFESMSAFTTTGLTMAVHEPSIGKGLLFYRSIAQWVGGAGFIIMALAIFRSTSGRSAILLYGSEATGEKLRPKIIETTRAIWKVYLILTLFSAIYLFIGTLLILPDYPISENLFDSINHAMTGQSTGGFSTLDDSIAGYHSAGMEILYLLPMILGAFSIPFYFKVIYEQKFSMLWKDVQTRSLIIAFIAGSIVQSFLLYKSEVISQPVREGVFQFVSAMSTTGWQTSNIVGWDWVSAVFIISFAMFTGGASGATVGGIKMMRAIMIRKGIIWQIKRVFYSDHTVKAIKFGNKSLHRDEMNEEFTKAASMAIMFILMILSLSILTHGFVADEYTFVDALFESTSAQCTVGLSTGITEPSMSPVLELMYIFQMWAGRLEIIPVLALIRAIFKGTNP